MGKLFDPFYLLQAIPKLLEYAWIALAVMAVTVLSGMILGVVAALIRVNHIKGLSGLCRIYISFTRGTPLIVQLFLCFFALPAFLTQFGADSRNIPVILYAYIVYSLHLGGYMAETLRGALLSLGTEQMEAACSIGMGKAKSYTRILLPQAFAISLPEIANLTIMALKDTSLLFNIGVVDMMTKAKLMGGLSQRYLELYIGVGIIYILLCIGLHLVFHRLERTLRVVKYGQ